MGLASAMFYSSDLDKETLHSRIVPSQEQRAEQTERWNELADYLAGWLKDETGLKVKTWLQGSYKFGTQIRPARKGEEFDIDLGIYLVWDGDPHERMSAKALKSIVQQGIQAFAGAADGIKELVSPPKERCARIVYHNDFHIDVPSYHLDEGRDARSLATERKGWESSDPKALVVWFRANAGTDDDRVQLRRIVRYLKMWAALKLAPEVRPSSILLTVLATDAVSEVSEDLTDDDAFTDVVERILSRLRADQEVPNPIDGSENLNRLGLLGTGAFIDKLEELLKSARRALKATSKLESADIWAEAFEHFFPVPDEEEVLGESATWLPVAVGPLDIEVVATPESGTGPTFRGKNKIGPIPKKYEVKFEVKTPLPLLSEVKWRVRNRGAEAESVNDMGHSANTGLRAEERSAYNGTHFMDCIAKQGDRIVGYRRVPVQIIDGVARNRGARRQTQYRSRRR